MLGDSGGEAFTRLSDLFWEALPQFLAIGMTAEEFWHGDPRLASAYRRAWELRSRERQWAEWRAGLYHAAAIGCCLSEKGEYPERPLGTVETADERAEREERAMAESRASMAALAEALNAKMKLEEE